MKGGVLQTNCDLYRWPHIFRIVNSTNAVGWTDWKGKCIQNLFGKLSLLSGRKNGRTTLKTSYRETLWGGKVDSTGSVTCWTADFGIKTIEPVSDFNICGSVHHVLYWWNKSNKMQQLRFLFAMALLYMFRVTISPIIRSTMLCMATGELAHLGCY